MARRLITTLVFLLIFFIKFAFLRNDEVSQFSTSLRPPSKKTERDRCSIKQQLEIHLAKLEMITEFKKETSELKQDIEDSKNYVDNQLKNMIKSEITEFLNKFKKETEEIKQDIEDSKNYVDDQLKNMIKSEIVGEFKKELSKNKEEIKDYVDHRLTKMKEDIISEGHKSVNAPAECKELKRRGNNVSGVYRIRPELSSEEFQVWCDMTTRGGGWIYVVNRFDGSQDFYLNWTDYKRGFGDVSGEYWLGLKHLYQLTNSKANELLFELTDWKEETVYAAYDAFKIGNEADGYSIVALGTYSGEAGDSFRGHLGHSFTTHDFGGKTCAKQYKSGWWYQVGKNGCSWTDLTTRYIRYPFEGNLTSKSSIKWGLFHGFDYSLKEAKMMIRPLN